MHPEFYIIFTSLILKILPLYILIFLGYIAGRLLKVDRKSIAILLFYIVVPIVTFDFTIKTTFRTQHLILPLLFFSFSSILCLSFLLIGKMIWGDSSRANVLAFSAGCGNTGYFGLPIALILFNNQIVGMYMLMNVGLSLYDYTVGAYVIAKGRYTSKQALKEVLKLPMVYAFLLGLIINLVYDIDLPIELEQITFNMRSCYVALGMMVIGLGLSTVTNLSIDLKFLTSILSAKFLATPLLIYTFIIFEATYLNWFEPDLRKAMLLISFAPPGANTVAFATLHNSYPGETATSVLLGTFIALVYIPLMVVVFF